MHTSQINKFAFYYVDKILRIFGTYQLDSKYWMSLMSNIKRNAIKCSLFSMFPADAVHLFSNGICFSVATVTLVSSIHNKNSFSDTNTHTSIVLKQHNISENAIFCYDTIRRIPSANQIEECSFEMLIIRLLFNNFILFHWYDFYVYSNSSYLFIEVLNFMFISMRSNDVFFLWIWLIHLMSHLQMKV